MKILPYIQILLTNVLFGFGVGIILGFSVGLYLMLTYHKQGPRDPADAPAMVAMGLILIGSCLGAIGGLAVGIIFCVRLARRKPSIQSI